MVTLREWGVSLGTRERGALVRQAVERALAGQPEAPVTIDLGGVERISPSFADECFGKLALDLGSDQTSRRLRFANADRNIAEMVLYAIRNRLSAPTSGQLPTPSEGPDSGHQGI